MKIRILHKAFLALLLSTGVALAAMAVLVQWNLGRGFLDYVNLVEEARLDELAAQLAEQYQANGGNWDWVLRNRSWEKLTGAGGGMGRPPPPPSPKLGEESIPVGRPGPSGPAGRPQRPPQHLDRQRSRHPPAPHERGLRVGEGRHNAPAPPFGLLLEMGPRINLFDAKGTRIIGSSRSLNGNRHRKAIIVGNQTAAVGWLTLDPIKQVSAVRDVNFLRQQSSAFITIAILLLLAAALLAIVLARHLTRPLGAVTGVVRQLAAGDYQSRVAARGEDEIAELAKNIDTLARTLDNNQQARQRWIADISHELRTPLAIMRAELEALQDGVRPLDSRSVDSVYAEVMRLGQLVNDLHELSLSDIGALTYKMLPIDLGELLDEATTLFRQRFASHSLELDYRRDADSTWPISGDRQRLLQLFTNLLENSLRYTDAGGRVVVKIRRHDINALVEITDTAPAVSIEECDKLFDRLYRVERSRNRGQGGSGLGLSICKNIADAHHASIQAKPSDMGGLTITVDIAMAGS